MGVLDSYAIDNFVINGAIGGVEKIISGNISLLEDITAYTVNISTIDITRSLLIFNQRYSGTTLAPDTLTGGKINNSTQLYFRRGASESSYIVYIAYQVIQFKKVKSNQKGEVDVYNESQKNITINSVNPLKSIVFASNYMFNNTHNPTYTMQYYLYNSTTLRLTFQATDTNGHVYWQVIEFE